MIVGEVRHGQLTIIDRLKETVRLSEGLKDNGALTQAARQRALQCLSRFGERLRDMHASSVRTAGTSALRRASDSGDFRLQAERALGHPIDVISGLEEARLIYRGMLHSLPSNDGFRLVMDIGGGSTELILGQADVPRALESLNMGCVVMTERYFPLGSLTRENFEQARLAARLKLRPVKAFFRDTTTIEAVGTSGTIISSERVARELGIIESNDLNIESVELLIEHLLEFRNTSELSMAGLSARRAQVWPGGLAILIELMRVLRIGDLRISDGALREGLLYDQLGRLRHEDARTRSVIALATRYNVDQRQAERVARSASKLLRQVAGDWGLDSELAGLAIDWSAQLHEIGLDVSHNGFQRHGAYVAENADLPGFPRSEQMLLAFLIATQRSNFAKSRLKSLPANWQEKALRLSILLRLAVLLNRSRGETDLWEADASAWDNTLELKFRTGWLCNNPLTIADLEREQLIIESVGYKLDFA